MGFIMDKSSARIAVTALLGLCLIMPGFSCAKKPSGNRVDMDQINYDDSTNYELLFKNQAEKQKERENRYKKDEF